MTEGEPGLRAELRDGRWQLAGAADGDLINGYLGYLADRGFSAHTVRAYAFDLLAFARWLDGEGIAAGRGDDRRDAAVPGVVPDSAAARAAGRERVLDPQRPQHRLCAGDHQPAAGRGLGPVRLLGDAGPGRAEPGAARRGRPAGGRPGSTAGCWPTWAGRNADRRLRVREPRRLPRGLDRAETAALLGSFRTDRDRAIAGLMLFSGLRSAEVLGLAVADVDIPRGWVRVMGKGGKERRVPLDPDVAGLIQAYLLAERPETSSRALFVVAKGPHRGQPLTAAGLRTIFRYHRGRAGVPAGHPHALRHSFGTALAEAGVDLAVLQALMGHDHVDSSAAYIHLAPAHVRAAYDAARQRQRAR